MAAKFEIYKDKKGEFRFRLKAANGEIIATGESYPTKAAVNKGIASMKKNAPIAEIEDTTEEKAAAKKPAAKAAAKTKATPKAKTAKPRGRPKAKKWHGANHQDEWHHEKKRARRTLPKNLPFKVPSPTGTLAL